MIAERGEGFRDVITVSGPCWAAGVPPAGPHFLHKKWGKECQGKEVLSPGPLSLVVRILFSVSAGWPWRATGWRAGSLDKTLRCRVPSWWARTCTPGTMGRRPGNSSGILEKAVPTSTGSRAEPWCSFSRLSPEKAGPRRRRWTTWQDKKNASPGGSSGAVAVSISLRPSKTAPRRRDGPRSRGGRACPLRRSGG